MDKIVIVSGVRSPIGSFNGALKDIEPMNLASSIIREAIVRSGLNPHQVDEVILGCVGQIGSESGLIARGSALLAGLSVESTALALNRQCSSGLQAIISAAMEIQYGLASIVVAGGIEMMSRYPYLLPKMRKGYRMGNSEVIDLLTDSLYDPVAKISMGMTAENLAELYHLSREELDRYAAQSHQRAAKAQADGKFHDEILPIPITSKAGITYFEQDEGIKSNTRVETLSTLRAAFKKDGVVTAGNSSTMNDGAAAVVVCSEKTALAMGLKPLIEIVDASVVGVDPSIMGIGPVPAIRKLLNKHHLTIDDIDCYEINEAFAAQALACIKELGLNPEKVNPNGSGISLGHPLGCTGAMITIKLMNEMIRNSYTYGIASVCVGGGQGFAVLFKRY